MRVTAIITNRVSGDYVAECVSSLTHQTRPPDTILIVDDATTDNSMESYKSIIDDVKVLRLEQKVGNASIKNVGVKETMHHTNFFAFLNANAIFDYKMIELALFHFDVSPRIGIVYADENIHDVINNLHWVNYREPFSLEKHLTADQIGNNFLITAQAMKEAGQFSEEVYELTARVARKYLPVHIADTLVSRSINYAKVQL